MEDLWYNDKIMFTNNLKKSYNYCFNDIFQKCQSILFNNTYRVLISATSGKEPSCQCRRCKRCWFNPWAGKIPWSRKCQPAPVFLPRKSHGWRSLLGYNPWGHKESDTTEQLHFKLFIELQPPVEDLAFFFREDLQRSQMKGTREAHQEIIWEQFKGV